MPDKYAHTRYIFKSIPIAATGTRNTYDHLGQPNSNCGTWITMRVDVTMMIGREDSHTQLEKLV